MWFFYALFSIFAWSGSDVFSKIGSKPSDRYSHWKMIMIVGFVMGLHALYELTIGGVRFDWHNMLTYLPVSFLYILSITFGYAGLRYIERSISSPICNSSGAVSAILCFLFLKQRMNGLQLFAVILITSGVVLLAYFDRTNSTADTERKYAKSFVGILLPILYCIIDGLGTFADALVLGRGLLAEAQANIATEFPFLAVGIFTFLYLIFVRRQTIRLGQEKPKILAAVCETAGQFTYIFAIGANAILAAPLIASYSIFSVLWSRLFLKERLTLKHYGIILIVLTGIFILGIE